jgi:hypothetical protein
LGSYNLFTVKAVKTILPLLIPTASKDSKNELGRRKKEEKRNTFSETFETSHPLGNETCPSFVNRE